ncbi:chaperone Clpb, putative [Entamoeba invadens IP1]|uniref:Chaperone Clpb, putative n=1 Tax=Entamoeba invadens IP1 TaxID=370355 RepID=A0A0A1UDE6_ENTIV|nr:chaperone Clpb, putative [Entamoeba invadens IP1]ELP90328.1 chaperone Clpb, putative [Entamoeba invadens IP1]|eukprot:XP_004257099.1 chaperone Clpb, putative [Entamoeba invadens IP1]
MGALIAGAQHRGLFEERLKAVLKEVKKSKIPIILFTQDTYTVLGAGATKEGVMDAANILRPILSRGELWCIEATIQKNDIDTNFLPYKQSIWSLGLCNTLYTKNSQPEEVDNLERKDTQLTVKKIANEGAEADNK